MALTLTPITLTAAISTFTGADLYGESDGLGLASQYLTHDVALTNISAQNHADGSTREPFTYNGLDVEQGMFIADTVGNTILKIISISEKGIGSLVCKVEDVDMMSYRLNSVNSISVNDNVKIFALNPEGEPVFAGAPFSVEALQKINSRFSLNERDDRVKFEHTLSTNLEKGDIVAVGTDGNLVKYGTTGSSDTKIGVVIDVYRNGKDIFVKPFNDIIRDYKDPEALTGNPGDVYYTDPLNPGEILSTAGGKSVFLHLNTKIPTNVNITSPVDPSSTDVVEINGVKVFDGPDGDIVADTDAFKTLINTFTAQTNVSAAITQAPGVVNAEGNSMAYPGTIAGQDMVIFTNIQGQAPTSGNFAACTLNDGNNVATVTFNNPDNTVDYGTIYEYAGPNAILAAFQSAITAGGLDIIAALYDSDDHDGQAIQLTTTGSATGITLQNTATDEFGLNVVGSGGCTGLTTSASLGASTLTLTRTSGGRIEISGSPLNGGYINTNGATTSNGGRVPYLLMIEDEAGAGAPDGAETFDDLNQTANVTSADGDFTGATISNTPYNDSNVQILVNGVNVNLGDGAKNKACYFSADGGATARPIADIEQSDALYWNGSIAGYELDGLDEIDIIYEK